MPDFTIIEGGGKGRPPEDFEALMAQKALRMLTIEMLRAMVRGDDLDGRVERNLAKFNDYVSRARASRFDIIRETIKALHERLNPERDRSSLSIHIDRIVRASLRVAAEGCCDDNAAAGRGSAREQDLLAAIDGFNQWYEKPRR
jgi:hypothetical protein